MNNNQIALYIGGTKQRQAGYTDLVILGLFPETEFNNMDRVTLISEKPVLIVKHTSDYILYQLVDRKVKSFDADANGVLCIATAISADMQFAAGKSPYTLLKEVYDKFRSSFMNPCSDGRDSFLDIETDNTVFQQIVSQYSLERRRGRNVVMTGSLTGQLAVPQEKIEAFFRDTQYPEFSAFKDIEIGTMCQSSPGLETLVIPRPVSYRVFVNDQLAPEEICIKDKLVQTNVPNGENICFTLAQLEAAPDFTIKQGKSEVMLDKANEKIICRIAKKDILYRCSIYVKGSASPSNKETVKRAILDGLIKVTETKAGFNIMDYQREGLNFEISSSKMVSKVFELDKMKYNGMELAIRSETNPQEQTINISIDVTEADPTLPVKTGKKDKTPQGTATRRAKGGNNQPDGTIYDEAKFLKEVNNAVKEREEELNADWEKRLRNGRLISLLIGISSTLALCALAFCVYYFFFDKEPELGKNAKEKIFKEMLTDDKKEEIFEEMLTEDKEEEIFNGFINKDGFYGSEAAQMIAEEYNKRHNNGRNPAVSSSTANDKALRDSQTQHKEEVAEIATKKATAHYQILEMVKQRRTYDECYRNDYFRSLDMEERIAVEWVLNYAKTKTKQKKNKPKTLIKAVEDNITKKIFDGREITWELLLDAKKAIEQMEKNQNAQVNIMKDVNFN